MIHGEHSDNKAAQVTFTSETWNHIQQELEQHFSEKRILGWYHTHPGFGIFLSAMDMFIHENFFNQSDQLALVYDPIQHEDGLFVWHNGQAERYQYLVNEDTGLSSQREAVTAKPRLTAAAHQEDHDLPTKLRQIERWNYFLGWSLLATLIFAIAWPFMFAWLDLSAFIRNPSGDMKSEKSSPVDVPGQPHQTAVDEFNNKQSRERDPFTGEIILSPTTPSTEESEPQFKSPNIPGNSNPTEIQQVPKLPVPQIKPLLEEKTKGEKEKLDYNNALSPIETSSKGRKVEPQDGPAANRQE